MLVHCMSVTALTSTQFNLTQVKGNNSHTIHYVIVPIGILPGPDVIMVKPNHMAFLHCEVYGNPKPRVTWTKGGASIDGLSGYNAFNNGTLLIQRTTEADKDDFTCRADNGVSEPVYRTLTLNLKGTVHYRLLVGFDHKLKADF